MIRKLPLGIQAFVKLREEEFVYVDKTSYIHRLVHSNVPCFLSRPRRFGKSLLLSTLRAYWEGKKDLFRDLQIERLEAENPAAWQAYPVFYFDFNGFNYHEPGALEDAINSHLKRWEQEYECPSDGGMGERFQNLLLHAHKQTSRRCVVLVDEYDKPLLDLVDDSELLEHNKKVFKGFFSTLKSFDEHIQFIFITGVTKFHKVSIFSDLNQLRDISMSEEYAGLCGITETEIDAYFPEEVEALATAQEMTIHDCRGMLQKQYDGYHFCASGDAVYNPFSLFGAFLDREFGSYWFETGTPAFLINRLRELRFDVRKFTNETLYVNEATLKDYTGDSLDPVPLLYQTGYLTIDSYDKRRRRYLLRFPNEEVECGFLESLIPSYIPTANAGNGLDIFSLDEAIESGNLDGVRDILTGLFANIPYTLERDPFEHYFQAVIYLIFTLLGKLVLCEMHTYLGRIDCKVETSEYIYLFEFKRDETAEEALAQIDTMRYALPFIGDPRKLFKVGVSFDSRERILNGWKVVET